MTKIPDELELAGTELSAFTALFVAFSFATSGAFVAAALAGAIGGALLVLYHVLEVRFINLEAEEIRRYAEIAAENVDDFTGEDDENDDR